MRILVVDDHAVVREGVLRLLSAVPAVTTLEAATAAEALAVVRAERVDLVILDLNLAEGESGLDLLRRLRLEAHPARVLVFSMHDESIYAARAIKAGALGYVSKSAPAEELVTAVARVAAGERYIDRDMAGGLVADSASGDPLERLTNREMEILRLLGDGKSLSGIAASLGIAYKTVANSCGRLKEKLGLERTADLIRLSIEIRRG